jgi:hypothetical protein
MATPNYGYEKRQRELAKKKKKEDKAREKAERKHAPNDAGLASGDPQSDAVSLDEQDKDRLAAPGTIESLR